MMTEIHDTHTCPCEMCHWARQTAANKPKSPLETYYGHPRLDTGLKIDSSGPSASAINPYEYLRTFKYAPPDAESEQPAEMTAPTFTEEWESAPRAMIRYVEQSIAEYWFLRGVRAGEAGAMVTMNEDLREIRRVAGERLTSAIREGR